MTTTPIREYITLKVHGEVSIEPEEPPYHTERGFPNYILVLIMGPTGAGKSSFIEALRGNTELGISKNQLESFTRTVSSYRVTNAEYVPLTVTHDEPVPVYLIDTPGFCDSKMSEMEIIEKLREWMGNHGIVLLHHILYLLPITDKRLPGRRKRVIEMFKNIVGGPGRHLTIVTTMWDQVWSDQGMERAMSNMRQLRDEAWEKYDGHGTILTKFHNTHESALDILGEALSVFTRYPSFYEPLIPLTKGGKPLCKTAISTYILRDLSERLEGLRQQKETLKSDLAQPDTQANEELESILSSQLQDVERHLSALENQIEDFNNQDSTTPETGRGEILTELVSTFSGRAFGLLENVSLSLKSWFTN